MSAKAPCRAKLLPLNRSGLYYEPIVSSEGELKLTKSIDELHLKRTFYGSKMTKLTLQSQDHVCVQVGAGLRIEYDFEVFLERIDVDLGNNKLSTL